MLTIVGVMLAVVSVVAGVRWAAGVDSDGPAGDREQPTPSVPTPTASSPTRETSPGPTFTATAQTAEPAGSELTPPDAVVLPSGKTMLVRIASATSSELLEVPGDISVAGWWEGGARIGDEYGAMVLASHVDSTTQRLGPFAELLDVLPGPTS